MHRRKSIFVLLPAALFVMACSCLGLDQFTRDPAEHINIRICSFSAREISNATLGSGTQNGMTHSTRVVGFDRQADGSECSDYYAVEPYHPNYDFIEVRFSSDHPRANVRMHPIFRDMGVDDDNPLEIGTYYTFDITFEEDGDDNWADGEALRVVQDQAPE